MDFSHNKNKYKIMRKLIFATLTIIFNIFVLSCSNGDDNNSSPYQGHWS